LFFPVLCDTYGNIRAHAKTHGQVHANARAHERAHALTRMRTTYVSSIRGEGDLCDLHTGHEVIPSYEYTCPDLSS